MSPAATLHAALHRRGETVAVAESLTGGLLSAAMTDTPGASETFRGGFVVYATDLKTALVGVPADLLAEHGPVHREVALALAIGALERCASDWGVGVTGVAGPDPQSGQPVGLVWAAVASRGGATWATARHLDGNRAEVRAGSVLLAISALSEVLADGGADR